MKTTKRLSIEFQHREVTVTVEGSALHVEPDVAHPPNFCPTCGSPWITFVAGTGGEADSNMDRIHGALDQSGLHLELSPTGQLRVCKRSFEELKEKL